MISEEEALKIFREMVKNLRITIEKNPGSFATKMYGFGARLDYFSRYVPHDKLRLCYYRFHNLRLVLAWKWDYLLQEQALEHLKASLSKEEAELNAIAIYSINAISRYALGDTEGRAILDIQRLRSDLGEEATFTAAPEELQSRVLLELTSALTNILDSFISSRCKEVSQLCSRLIQACDQGWDSVFNVIDECILAADKIYFLEMRR